MTDLDTLSAATHSAVFSDICDQLGLRAQAADIGLTSINSGGTLVGWARTVSSVPVDVAPPRAYGGEIDFIDSLRPGDVVVAQTHGAPAAFWGELFSAAAVGRGARGAVIDGYIRDRVRIDDPRFQVFAAGTRPTDCLGRIAVDATGGPVELGGVAVAEGDLVVADGDGIVIVPAALAQEVIDRALAKAATESSARAALRGGGYLREVWERFGVL